MPSRMKYGSEWNGHGADGTLNMLPLPKISSAMIAAPAEESRIGTSRRRAWRGKTTSSAKSAPAIGLPNTAEMPAAVPQTISVPRLSTDSRQSQPVLLPMAAPVSTLGVSSPAEPPRPTVTALVKICEKVSSHDISGCFSCKS